MNKQVCIIPNIVYKLAIELSIFTESAFFYNDNRLDLELYRDEILIIYIKLTHNIKVYDWLSIIKLIPKSWRKLLPNSNRCEELWNKTVISNSIAKSYYSLLPYEEVTKISKEFSYLLYKYNILITSLKSLPKAKAYYILLSFPDLTEFSSLIQINYDNDKVLFGQKHNLNDKNLKCLKEIFYAARFFNYENF